MDHFSASSSLQCHKFDCALGIKWNGASDIAFLGTGWQWHKFFLTKKCEYSGANVANQDLCELKKHTQTQTHTHKHT